MPNAPGRSGPRPGPVRLGDGAHAVCRPLGHNAIRLEPHGWLTACQTAGHLIQAGVAARNGDGRLLEIAERFAGLLVERFGSVTAPAGRALGGGRAAIDSHPEIEMALVELWRETGRRPCLDRWAAVPYYRWANRGESAMRVWLPLPASAEGS
jgi:DUF1680 family protein